jgi:hypothetical protein
MKVYFAGMEQMDFACLSNRVAGTKYALFSVFSFICNGFGIDTIRFKNTKPEAAEYLTRINNGVIMDSGLFTLMFGAHAGARDKDFVYRWQDAIVKYVNQYKYCGTVVECDCQKILGVDHAWALRKRLREALPNQQITVWHWDDRKDGLDRMIEFSDI